MKYVGSWTSNGLQWLDLKIGHQNSSPSNDHHIDMLYCVWSTAQAMASIQCMDYNKRDDVEPNRMPEANDG